MKFGVRGRLLLWLGLFILPVGVACWISLEIIEQRLGHQVEGQLENVRGLEAARINDALESYARDATSLAAGGHVQSFVAGVGAHRSGTLPVATQIGGVDGFAVVDPDAARPLDELAQALLNKATTTGSEVAAVQLLGRDGSVLGSAGGYDWMPYDPGVITRAMRSREPVFGNAFRDSDGAGRLGLVAPIFDADARVVGALALETNLGPIVNLVVRHEGYGDTSEGHIAQPTPNGDAEFITLLRFERNAAFSKVVPAETGLPINQSLMAPGGRVIEAPDYRGVESILAVETIAATGWGLVVKIDRAEAYAGIADVREVVALAAAAATLVALLGWLFILRPLGHRLRRSALAAERVAAGEYRAPIGDNSSDEIGELSRTIDRLATELDRDIQARTIVEERLRHRATHDELTGLRNRQHATEILTGLLTGEDDAPTSLLFLDVDRFKAINDTHGHSVGDETLVAISRRLLRAVDEGSTVARWGGDEFVVVLPGCRAPQAAAISGRLKRVFEEPIVTSAGPLTISCSIGSATSSEGSSFDQVLKHADAGMFTDKEMKRARRAVVGDTSDVVAAALQDERVEAWYQPIVSATSGDTSLFGVEALVRLRTPGGDVVPPGAFLPGIQGTALGVELDLRMARLAMADLARWRAEGRVGRGFKMSLNLGAASVAHPTLADDLTAIAADAGLSLEPVIIELPEGADDLDPRRVEVLRATGATLAIDDFGADYSRLDRLMTLSAHVLKLDRGWLAGHGNGFRHRERVVLGKLVDMCAELGMQLVAEGVETPAQLTMLVGLGVPHFQGFHFARPQTAEVFEGEWLESARTVRIPG